MPRHPDPDLARQWAQRMRRFERSDATVAQFCRQEGVSSAAFYQWKRKLNATNAPTGDRSPTPHFVPVQVVAEDDSSHALEIQLPNGAVVLVPAALEMDKVCQLVAHVAALEPKEDPAC